MSSKLIGNQFWKLRTSFAKERIFGDGEVLKQEARLFFDWCDRNPWMREELVKHQGMAEAYSVPLGRPYTMDALCTYLNVSGGYFRQAKSNLREKIAKSKATEQEVELLEAIEWVESVCRSQCIEGAAVGVFNANIVARIYSLADNVNNHNKGETSLRVTVRDQKTADDMDALEDLL